MAYNRVNWKNGASGGTPVGATNLNIMDEGIANNDTEIEKLKTDKADKTEIPDVSTLATKTELGAKADKTELSAYMPKSGGAFTGGIYGENIDEERTWKILDDGSAELETLKVRSGLEGTSDKAKCLAEDMSDWSSIQPPNYYMSKGNGIYTEFKNSDAVGRTEKNFWNVTTIVQYENFVGNRPTQFATSEGIMLKRYGTSDTEWSDWEEVGSGGGGSAEWTGTKERYKEEEDSIPVGTKVNITNDYVEPTSGGGSGVRGIWNVFSIATTPTISTPFSLIDEYNVPSGASKFILNLNAFTNTSNNHGIIKLFKNNAEIKSVSINSNVWTSFSFEGDCVEGDKFELKYGWSGSHSSCYYQRNINGLFQ